MTGPATFVTTRDAKAAVQGHEEAILDSLGIDWKRGHPHIDCPYPEHGGANDWRWDARRAKAFCTCSERGDGIIDVLAKCEGMDFDAAKIRAVEMVGRSDLVRTKNGKGQRADAEALMRPPSDMSMPDLPRAYLAHRLGIASADVLMPSTPAVGWRTFPYFDAPPKGSGKPVHVGDFPCCVFGTVDADGRTHAHRIYVAPGGAGKADLGETAAGYPRDPKKSAKVAEGDKISGRSVLWGDPARAAHLIVGEGIETCAAVAHAMRREIEAGSTAVAAAISAGGVEAFQVYPATKRVTVAADRDEKAKVARPEPTRRGERAAREFGMRRHDEGGAIEVRVALPGAPGSATDWLDVLLSDGVEAVRAGIEGATRFVPTAAELQARIDRAGREAELERVAVTYPLPALEGRALSYQHTSAGRVWVHKTVMKGKGENAVPISIAVASPFGITARLRIVDDDDAYGLRILIEDMDGKPRTVDVERKTLATMGGTEARGLFLESGVRFEDDGDLVAVACLKGAHPAREIRIVRHPGWHEIEGRRVFVAPGGEVIGLPEGEGVELAAGAILAPPVARGGTLDGWKRAAAAAFAAPGCPHFVLGLAAGFAGVIVNLCGMDSCGINLSGQTSAGKTTGQRLSSSAWSVPDSTRGGLFQVAKTTVNGFEFMAARANGTIFALDELAHLSGRETAKVIYTLASGIGKTRMTAGASMREPHRWQTFAVLSSETSLEAKIRADGEVWTGGQAVRIADVDVTGINRMLDATTFDNVASVARHYGHAGPAFVRALVDSGLHLRASEIKQKISDGARRLAGSAADAATIRAALPLAILSAAGGLAQTFGLLPAGPAVQEAVAWAWIGFQGSKDAVALDPATQAIESIRQWIAERWRTSLHGLMSEERPTRDAVGWWDDSAVYIPADRLVEAAGNNLKEALIAKVLSEQGMLAKTKSDRHLYINYVPTLGFMKAYALSRKHFGRGQGDEEPMFRSVIGGRS